MELRQRTLSFITLVVVWNMARAMFSNNCAARYSNSFFVNESTFDSGSSVISSCSPAGSFIECCTLCRPGTTCAGVVYLEEKCCHLTMGSGAVFRQMAVADDLKLPRVMLYDDCTIPSVSTLYYNFYFNTFILTPPGWLRILSLICKRVSLYQMFSHMETTFSHYCPKTIELWSIH